MLLPAGRAGDAHARRGRRAGGAGGDLIYAKPKLHRFSRELVSDREIADGLVLLAGALIVLPLLPDEPIGPYGALNLATV